MIALALEVALGFIIGYIAAHFYEQLGISLANKTKKPPHLDISGWRLHHSLYGLPFLALGLPLLNPILITTIGIGIITQHYFTGDGLVFLTRVR